MTSAPELPAPCWAQNGLQVMRLRYRTGPIGEGSFGRVYMALVTNEHALRPVALKKVHIADRVAHPPLLHEAAALLRLRGHRSIPEVYGWGSSQHFEYLSLQLLGRDLYAWFILMKKPLTSRNLTAIVWQMLDALEYIHSQGIIHCDIKPPNIMLGRGDNKSHVFLCDFALSLPFDPNAPPSERTTLPRGSGFYMSLNNHLSRALTPHDDMESLAYSILELQTGGLPWDNCMSHADVFVSKQRWTGRRWTSTTGCPQAFGDFLDAVRDRSQALDYARWKRDLCGDSTPTPPGAEAPFKYNSLDVDAPMRRTVYNDSEFHISLAAAERAQLPEWPEPWPTVSGSSHGFHPFSTWSGPVTLEDAATFGDERELVRRGLALIDRPPTCEASSSSSDPLEVMKRFDDVLNENVGGTGVGHSENDNEDRWDGSEPVDRGRDGSTREQGGSDRVQVQVNGIAHEAGDIGSVLVDSDIRQFYDPEYDRD